MAEATVHKVRLADPASLERSTFYVLVNTAATGALGSLFWLIAPRMYDDAAVAAAVAASSLLITFGFVAQLNLATALSRFLPQARSAQRHLVSFTYRISVAAACVVAVAVVLVGVGRGGSVVEGGDFGLTIALALSIPLWTIFALQDGALVAVRKAVWLPIENGATAIAKLLLLPLLGGLAARSGILLAWTLPIIPAILIVNHSLYRRLLDPGAAKYADPSAALRYALTDLPGIALTMISLRVVPVYVLETQGSETGARIGVPWSIVSVSALALPAISRLALSEMAHHPDDSQQLLGRLNRFVWTAFVPGAIVAAALSPVVLRVAGSSYAREGSLALALGMIGLVPAALVELQLAELRFGGRLAATNAIQAARAAAVLIGVAVVCAWGHPAWVGGVFASVNLLALVLARLVRR